MEHTLFFQERKWTGSGEYIDETGRSIPFEGMARTVHGDDLWFHEVKMTLSPGDGPTLTFENRYDIVPFQKGKVETVWTSSNPSLGFLTGRFVVVNEAILSFCSSENGVFTGHEVLVKIDDTRYGNWGTLFRKHDRISSWSLRLRWV
jgi:hypothetical protein